MNAPTANTSDEIKLPSWLRLIIKIFDLISQAAWKLSIGVVGCVAYMKWGGAKDDFPEDTYKTIVMWLHTIALPCIALSCKNFSDYIKEKRNG